MATSNEIRIKSECLLQELEIWRFTVTPHSKLFDKDAFLRDFLAFKIDIAQGFIEESYKWEKSGNETKRKSVIDHAEMYLGQIQDLFDKMFADQDQENWQDMEEEVSFPDLICVS